MVLTVEGYLLLEDQNFESLKKGTWVVVSPIDSIMSQVHQATAYVSCLETHAQSKATKTCESKWTENREQGELEMINDLEVTDKLHETDELHIKSAKELSDHAARFQPSYWTFVGPSAENIWNDDKCQTGKPNRNWDGLRDSSNMVRFWTPSRSRHHLRAGQSQVSQTSGQHPLRGDRAVRQHDLQADQVGNKPPVHSLRLFFLLKHMTQDVILQRRAVRRHPQSENRALDDMLAQAALVILSFFTAGLCQEVDMRAFCCQALLCDVFLVRCVCLVDSKARHGTTTHGRTSGRSSFAEAVKKGYCRSCGQQDV